MIDLDLISKFSNWVLALIPILIVLTPRVKLNSFEILSLWIVSMGSVINLHTESCDILGRTTIDSGLSMLCLSWYVRLELKYFKGQNGVRTTGL